MPPPSQATLFCSADDVRDILTALGADSRLDDDGGGTPGAVSDRVMSRALNVGTARVLSYLQPRYATADLVNSWAVNEYAARLAALQVCRHGGQAVPASVKEAADEAVEDLKAIKAGDMVIPDVGVASPDWPAWSNITVDPRYRVRQARVQRGMSERTPTQYPQADDLASDVIWEA